MIGKSIAWAALATVGLASAAILQVVPATATNDVPALKTGRVTGTVLSVYNTPATFEGIKRGLKDQNFRLLRFPNGSMSNMYHWNGAGTYDSTGVWHTDSASVLPGILTLSKYRGTTQQYSGAGFHSRITDGVDSTLWWSDPVGAEDPWILLNFLGDSTVDSVHILWGALQPDSVVVGKLATSFWNGFGGLDAQISPYGKVAVSGTSTILSFPDSVTQFLAIKPIGVKAEGVQIAEVTVWANGKQVTVNTTAPDLQTQVTAMGAHPGNYGSPNWVTPPAWTFDKFVEYIQTMSDIEALICVNYGTGTPEEAAAWVKYANVTKKLGIKFWEIGNEMDGYWEEGGPVTAAQYARKYLAYARAMKRVDPSILIFGPVMSTSEFDNQPSMSMDGRTWTEEILRIVGEAEVKDGVRYLDGFDFHAYPYWTESKPNAQSGLAAVRKLKARMDTLRAMMKRQLKDPETRLVNMSEINLSVVSSSLLAQPENAVAISLALSELIEVNGGNSMSIVWEGFNGGSIGAANNGGSWGSLSLFNEPRSGLIASEPYAPSAAYWGNWMVSKVWAIDSAKPLPATVTGSSVVEARALVNGTDTSWLVMNLFSKPCTTQVSGFSKGWIYTFSSKQFAWNGTSDQAYAFPNSGPSGMPIPAAWNRQVEIPAYGMVVVRNTPAPTNAAVGTSRPVNVSLFKKQIEVGDTVKVSGTMLRSPEAAAPSLTIGTRTYPLQALDGAWDSDQEGFVTSVLADSLGEGDWVARVGLTDSVPFRITGKVRPNVWIDRFDDKAFASEQPSKMKWDFWQADKEDSSAWNLSFEAREGNTYALRSDATLVQPTDLGYTVAGYTGLILDLSLVTNSLGIKFDYATRHSNKAATFALGIPTDTVKDYQDYSISLKNTDSVWTTVRVLWSQFSQPSWAKPCGPLLPRHINALNFRAQGAGKAIIWLDNVALLGTTGDSVTGVRSLARAAWGVRRIAAGWQIKATEGAQVSMVALDGRRVARFTIPASGEATWTPRGTGVVYMILETADRRLVKTLPNLR